MIKYYLSLILGVLLIPAVSSAATLIVTTDVDAPLAPTATTCTTDLTIVDGSACSLRAAMMLAADGDVIEFAPTVTLIRVQSELRVNANVTIRGTAAQRVTIDGSFKYPLLYSLASNTRLEFLNFVNGRSIELPPILFGSRDPSCIAYMIDVRVLDNASDSGTVVSRCTLAIQRGEFERNQSQNGAIYQLQRQSGGLVTADSVFRDNTSYSGQDFGGSAIWADAAVIVNNTLFENNQGSQGGAIHATASLGATNQSRFVNNRTLPSGPSGGDIGRSGGAVWLGPTNQVEGPARTVVIKDVKFENNTAIDAGGALAIVANVPVNIANSAFLGNQAGMAGGGIFSTSSQATTIVQSSISKNTLTGVQLDTNERGGGGLYFSNYLGVVLTMRNVTVASNVLRVPVGNSNLLNGGGLAIFQPRVVLFNHVTIADNEIYKAEGAGVLFRLDSTAFSSPSIRISNSIISRNKGSQDCFFSLFAVADPLANVSRGFNAVGNSCPHDQGTDTVTDEPGLDPAGVRDNGGPSPTVALVSGSLAIDAATTVMRVEGDKDTDAHGCEPTDQRLVSRPLMGGRELRCDIGAFEYQRQADVSVVKTVSGSVVAGQALQFTINVTNLGPDTADAVTVTDVLPPGLVATSASSTLGSCATVDQTITCSLGDLIAGGAATIVVVANTTVQGVDSNTATVTSQTLDTDLSNNSSTVRYEVTGGGGAGSTTGGTTAGGTTGLNPQGENDASVRAASVGSFSGSGIAGRPGCQMATSDSGASLVIAAFFFLRRRLVKP